MKENLGKIFGRRMVMRKALMIASMASMLDNFNSRNIEILHDMGYEITLAANFEEEDSNSKSKVNEFREKMKRKGYKILQIDFSRKLQNISGQIISYMQIKQLEKEHFDLIHCHSPICSALTRIAFRKLRKRGTKIIYTAHGFHFYKGAPIQNWLLFYPIEKICSRWTDYLIVINKEDYKLAKKKMKAKSVKYIPGVGVDIQQIANVSIDKRIKRKEFNIPEDIFLLFSVGELNKNKNHEIIIRAISKIGNANIHYAIAGKGSLYNYLVQLASNLNVNEQVHFLGFRQDIGELYKMADVCCFPSIREGLGLAAIEGMAAGLPIIASDNRGTREYVKNAVNGYLCKYNNCSQFIEAINRLYKNVSIISEMGNMGYKDVMTYDIKRVDAKMLNIYSNL